VLQTAAQRDRPSGRSNWQAINARTLAVESPFNPMEYQGNTSNGTCPPFSLADPISLLWRRPEPEATLTLSLWERGRLRPPTHQWRLAFPCPSASAGPPAQWHILPLTLYDIYVHYTIVMPGHRAPPQIRRAEKEAAVLILEKHEVADQQTGRRRPDHNRRRGRRLCFSMTFQRPGRLLC
jgi:hypothetical protein